MNTIENIARICALGLMVSAANAETVKFKDWPDNPTHNWSDTSSWEGGVAPGAGDDVLFDYGQYMVITDSFTIKSFAVNNTSWNPGGIRGELAGKSLNSVFPGIHRALEILERNEMIPEQLKYCPRCHSDDIRFVLKKRHRLRALFSGIIAALAAAPPGTEHWEFVCRNCGAHFDCPVSRHSKE